jgi:hypothetical protein
MHGALFFARSRGSLYLYAVGKGVPGLIVIAGLLNLVPPLNVSQCGGNIYLLEVVALFAVAGRVSPSLASSGKLADPQAPLAMPTPSIAISDAHVRPSMLIAVLDGQRTMLKSSLSVSQGGTSRLFAMDHLPRSPKTVHEDIPCRTAELRQPGLRGTGPFRHTHRPRAFAGGAFSSAHG